MPRLPARAVASRLHRPRLATATPLTIAVLAVLGGPAAAQAPAAPAALPAPALRLERSLVDRRNDHPPSFARADRIDGAPDDEVVLTGNAELRKAGAVLRGDRIVYTHLTNSVQADGNVRLFRSGTVFSGPTLTYELDTSTGRMPDADYSYTPRQGRGKASLVEFLSDTRARMTDATYSTCTPDDNAWWVQAEQLDFDKIDESATGEWAKLYFKGVPIAAFPVFGFPLGERRRSGLLTPSFGLSSTQGTDISVPYYWNIAPNYDATFTPRLISKRGLMLGSEFRFLEPTAKGAVHLDVLPNDRITGTTRDLARVLTEWNSPTGFAGGLNITRVSDIDYFKDISNNILGTSQTVLVQDGFVGYNQPLWQTAVRITKNQPLFEDPAQKPYERVPQLTLNAFRADWSGFEAGIYNDATRFEHPTKVQGWRYMTNPKVSYPFLSPGWFVVPKVQLSSTRYELDTLEPGLVKSASRTLPIASLDAGLVFERPIDWFGRKADQTLEPRLFYTYIPYRDQSQLPNFDSALPDLNFAQLFTENVYSGYDRIGEANQLTAVLTTRVLDKDTGAERLRAAIGQRFYDTSQRVTLPGVPARTGGASDLLAALTAILGRSWAVDLAAQYATEQSQMVRATAGVRWQPAAASVISAYYRYRVDDISQVDVAAQWPLTNRWYGVARVNYSTRDSRLIEALGGFEYKADCWVLRGVLQRFVTSATSSNTGFFLQLELNGLTSVGSSPVTQLRRNIPGYQLINPLPREPGRFDYYE